LTLTGPRRGSSPWGLPLAAAIGLGWSLSLIVLLRLDLAVLPWPLLVGAVLLRTLLHTGLFIVGHDAMHGVLVPGRRRWNDRLGATALALYAALPYGSCRRNHQLHHRCTATAADPDYHPDARAGFWAWYRRFMAGYLGAGQMARLLTGWAGLAAGAWALGSSGPLNVLCFCVLPLLLSSLQLFGFGTYLPHRQQRLPLAAPDPASLDLPVWLSLLACFHFSYHLEHHQNPSLAWFELPAQRRLRRRLASAVAPA
jgi:beta-carotene ketolase (CrtW type)